jgi:hypothetical protein
MKGHVIEMKDHAMRQIVSRAARLLAPVAMVAALAVSAACAHAGATAKAAKQASRTSAQSGSCTLQQRREALSGDQHAILAKLGSLVTLRNNADVGQLAKIGYAALVHGQTSLKGMGLTVMGDMMHQAAHRPAALFYRPRPGAPNGPRDGLDFPYHLAGWAYPLPYDWHHSPTLLPCVNRADWFIHERGLHLYDTGGFLPVPPKEVVYGTAAGADAPKVKPPNFSHPRAWDIHVWLTKSGIPTIGITNPGKPIPGLAVPPGSFFYPPQP